jgi:hypothetical protein
MRRGILLHPCVNEEQKSYGSDLNYVKTKGGSVVQNGRAVALEGETGGRTTPSEPEELHRCTGIHDDPEHPVGAARPYFNGE